MFRIELFSVKTNLANSARNLGLIFEQNFIFRSYISAACSLCFYQMQNLLCICRYLDLESAKLFATAPAPSRLDYCNSLLYNITNIDLTRLQCVQNRLARSVTKSPPFTCRVPMLRSLQCLSARFRIMFKTNLLTHKTLCDKQPVYLQSMLATPLPSLSLRSNKDNSLSVSRVKTKKGEIGFHSCVPSLRTDCWCLSAQPLQ